MHVPGHFKYMFQYSYVNLNFVALKVCVSVALSLPVFTTQLANFFMMLQRGPLDLKETGVRLVTQGTVFGNSTRISDGCKL